MIKTKSAYKQPESSDGSRYLVSRYWPRGMTKERMRLTGWVKDLAPSRELLRDWKDGAIDWAEYTERYCTDMAEQREQLRELAEEAYSGVITLICFENEEDPHCHRHLLRAMIQATGGRGVDSGREATEECGTT